MARRILTAREQDEMLSPWRMAASVFNPEEVTKKLKGEFYNWQDQQPADRYSDEERINV